LIKIQEFEISDYIFITALLGGLIMSYDLFINHVRPSLLHSTGECLFLLSITAMNIVTWKGGKTKISS